MKQVCLWWEKLIKAYKVAVAFVFIAAYHLVSTDRRTDEQRASQLMCIIKMQVVFF